MPAKKIFHCQNCGNEYSTYYDSKLKFCCRECQKEFTAKSHERACQQCGQPYIASPASAGKFCSHFCYGESLKGQKPNNYNRAEKTCELCGKVFFVSQYRADAAKFCSTKCHDQARLDRVMINCDGCGLPFEAIKSQSHLRTCSRECHSRIMSGPNCNLWNGGQRQHYYGPDWRSQRAACRARDNHTCRICSKKHQKGKRLFDVHHVRPFRSFGYKAGQNENYRQANDLPNLITVCLSCHMKIERGRIAFQPNLL